MIRLQFCRVSLKAPFLVLCYSHYNQWHLKNKALPMIVSAREGTLKFQNDIGLGALARK